MMKRAKGANVRAGWDDDVIRQPPRTSSDVTGPSRHWLGRALDNNDLFIADQQNSRIRRVH